MNNIIQNLSEITDSREMLEAKPHKFTSTFAYGLIAILAIALIWTYFGELDIVVKSNGVVRSNDKTISVLNEVDGKVSEVRFKEGQIVKKGDILYSLECKDAILSKKNYDKQLITLQTDMNNMDKLRNSILDNKNNFDVNNSDEKDYYNKYLQYTATNEKLLLTQIQTGLQSSVTNNNKQISSKSISEQISESGNVINSLNVLLKSIKDNKSNFSESNSKYSAQYSDYQFNIQGLQNSIQQKKVALQNAEAKYIQATTEYQSQIDNAQAAYNNAVLKLAQYKSQYTGQIASSITQTTTSLSDIQGTDPTASIKITQTSISNLQLLVKSINLASNLFTDSNSTYYKQYVDYTNNYKKYKYEPTDQEGYKNSYLFTINQSIDTSQNDLTKLQANSSAISVKAGTLNETIHNLQLLQSSISKNQNNFEKSNIEYYSKFIDYQNNVEELQNNIDTQAKVISSLATKKDAIINDYISQLTVAQKVLEGGGIDLSKYENQGILDIKSKLDEAGKVTRSLQVQLNQAKLNPKLDNINDQLATNDITKYKMDILVQLADGIKQNKQKLDELKTNIESLQLNIDKSTVKAPIDGVVNVKNDIAKSQLVKSGQEVLSVIPQSSSNYRVQLYVSNKDIIGMKIGGKIKYHFQALPYREYGEFTGTITDIAVDSTVDQQSGTSYYLVESEILNKSLFSYKGEKGELKIGMTCEAQAITKRKKILYYLLEKINLRN